MPDNKIPGGTVHKLPADLKKSIASSPAALAAWRDITPLARNEWICWTTYPKLAETRKEHVKRARSELIEGMRRPCCWLGCPHRKDKSLSRSQKFIIGKK
ncbi:YdeI/OmpD-associated family protein [Patescibacteria group bacterium]|nr:YdeI/OmpD-associated family protein [Patescibacteria group bacterium]